VAELTQAVAILAAGLFAGAAIYIGVAEHPARMECGTTLAATVFGPSYRRAAAMQATLAMVGSVAGIIAWRANAGAEWLTGSLVLFFVVPFTFAAIMPTNKRLLDPGLDRASVEAQLLLVRWGRLHAGRGLAGAVSFVIFVWAARS
jgi:hypothetical protein